MFVSYLCVPHQHILALYTLNFCSFSDLSFKKGDIVILRKKIDNNWYFGECGNNHGVFPLSYVQVHNLYIQLTIN